MFWNIYEREYLKWMVILLRERCQRCELSDGKREDEEVVVRDGFLDWIESWVRVGIVFWGREGFERGELENKLWECVWRWCKYFVVVFSILFHCLSARNFNLGANACYGDRRGVICTQK